MQNVTGPPQKVAIITDGIGAAGTSGSLAFKWNSGLQLCPHALVHAAQSGNMGRVVASEVGTTQSSISIDKRRPGIGSDVYRIDVPTLGPSQCRSHLVALDRSAIAESIHRETRGDMMATQTYVLAEYGE